MDIEQRYCEIRAEGRKLNGVAVRYGDVAALPFGKERIEAGAFSPLGDAILNSQHDRAAPLARTGGGGLVLKDSDEALSIEAELPNTRATDDVLELVRTKVIRGLSIEFRAVKERAEAGLRIIERAVLVGVAVVDTPAYPASVVEARMKEAPPPRRMVWL